MSGVPGSALEVSAVDAAAEVAAAAEVSAEARPVLLDVRTREELEVASIAGAMHVPMQEMQGRVLELQELKTRRVIVFCHGGVRSLQVTKFLRGYGFTDVVSMAGGIDAWSREVDGTVPRY